MSRYLQNIIRVCVFVLLIMIANACSHTNKKQVELQIVTNELEKEYAKQLTQALEKKYGVWKDKVVEDLLKNISIKISASDIKYKNIHDGISFVILKTNLPIAYPGLNKVVYLSKGILEQVEYENELAFLISTPLIMIKKQLPVKRFEKLLNEEAMSSTLILPIQPKFTRVDCLNSGWFDSGGFFDFGVNEYIEADKEAVLIPTKAKYDHRGGLSLYQRLIQEPHLTLIKNNIHFLPEINERVENIKIETSKMLPIRDAVLKSRIMRDFKTRIKEKNA